MNSSLRTAVDSFIAREKLPSSYRQTVEQWFLPLAQTILQQVSTSHRTLIVGISGSQGCGKSTLAALLVLLLRELMGLRAINLSIDDFYHTHATRQQLARTVHPLLATRGVPGTHDVALAMQTLTALTRPGEVLVPRFNKVMDDRMAQSEWQRILAPLDVIVLEGWCLAIPAQPEPRLSQPVNMLETQEDCDGRWRQFVNTQIKQDYAAFFALVDFLVMLKAPSFDKVYEWRQNQEAKLAEKVMGGGGTGTRLMDKEQLQRFIQHYERLTRHALEVLPALADVVFELTDQQTIAGKLKG
jgi:D-glycerate 3-kinase